MPNKELRVRTLYTRRRRLHAALADMERREGVIRFKIAEVEAELLTHVLFVPPIRRNKPTLIVGRELLDYLGQCNGPQSTADIARWVVRQKGIEVTGAKHMQKLINRTWRVLTELREREVVKCEGERKGLRWRLALPNVVCTQQ